MRNKANWPGVVCETKPTAHGQLRIVDCGLRIEGAGRLYKQSQRLGTGIASQWGRCVRNKANRETGLAVILPAERGYVNCGCANKQSRSASS